MAIVLFAPRDREVLSPFLPPAQQAYKTGHICHWPTHTHNTYIHIYIAKGIHFYITSLVFYPALNAIANNAYHVRALIAVFFWFNYYKKCNFVGANRYQFYYTSNIGSNIIVRVRKSPLLLRHYVLFCVGAVR